MGNEALKSTTFAAENEAKKEDVFMSPENYKWRSDPSIKQHKGWVSSVQSLEGRVIISGGYDAVVREWEVNAELDEITPHVRYRPCPNIVRSIGRLPSSFIAVGHSAWGGAILAVYEDTEHMEVKHLMRGHTHAILDICGLKLNGDGDPRILSASADCTVRYWDPMQGKELWSKQFESRALTVTSIGTSDRIAAGLHDNSIVLWSASTDLTDEKHQTTLKGHSSHVSRVRYCSSSGRLISSSYDGSLREWDIETSECISSMVCENEEIFAMDMFGSLPVAGYKDNCIRTWDARSAENNGVRAWKPHEDRVYAVNCSSDLSFIVSGSRDMTVQVTDPRK
jgi:WD40 repeat protein